MLPAFQHLPPPLSTRPRHLQDAPVLHISYHDGNHYNSVRNADDFGSGPPTPLRPLAAEPVAGAAGEAAPVAGAAALALAATGRKVRGGRRLV